MEYCRKTNVVALLFVLTRVTSAAAAATTAAAEGRDQVNIQEKEETPANAKR